MVRRAGLFGGALLLLAAYAIHAGWNAGTEPVAKPHDADKTADLQTLLRTADPSRGAGLFGQCAACHTIGRAEVDRDGPNLYGVVGSRVAGRRPLYAYTAALRSIGGVWSPARLDAWLTNPAAVAPGTKMVFGGVVSAKDRADLIAFLNTRGLNSPLQ